MLAENAFLSLNKLAFHIGLSRSALLSIAEEKSKHYRPYTSTIRKKDGTIKKRSIDNPDKSLRKVQQIINKKMLKPLCSDLPAYSTGSIAKRNTYSNAVPHMNKEALLLVDISNCFPSIRSSDVYHTLKRELKCSPPVAKLLTRLVTYGDRLPQGAPTSPSLCNLVMKPLAQELNEIAKANDLVFTQYVDDLTFSGNYAHVRSTCNKIIATIQEAGFKVNRKKLKIIKHGSRMEVTGLVVNQQVSVGRRYIRKIQRDIMALKSDDTKVKGRISYVKSVTVAHARKLTKRLKKVSEKTAD